MLLLIQGCEIANEKVISLQQEKVALQKQLDSLATIIADLRKTPDDLISNIRQLLKDGDVAAAKNGLLSPGLYQLSQRQIIEINLLQTTINHLEEEVSFKGLSLSDTALYSVFIKKYPKSKYIPAVRKTLIKLRHAHTATMRYSYHIRKVISIQKPIIQKSYGRVGALCCDGSRSYATGRGACSHHGGVCQWLYN